MSFYSNILRKNTPLYSVKIKNSILAKNLEYACQRNGGFLTYAEYFDIVQYGEYGYQARTKNQGQTEVYKNWAPALAVLCKQQGIRQIVEFGAGDGSLGTELLAKFRTIHKNNLLWIAVEREKSLQKQIKEKLSKHHLHGGKVVSSLKDVKVKGKTLILFPYSLDSIGPEIFINTNKKKSFPNAMIGITVQNKVLREIIISRDMLQVRRVSLKDGIYSDNKKNYLDLSLWKLFTGQRAYISIHALILLKEYSKHFSSDSLFIIIDEFRQSPFPWELKDICLPRDFYHKNRDCLPIKKYYHRAADDYLYTPIFLQSMLIFLHALGFRSINYDFEQKIAHQIIGRTWVSFKRRYFTYVFLASKRDGDMRKVFPVDYPKRTFFL